MTEELTIDTITFGQYKNAKLSKILRDRTYCKWLLKQEWFKEQYEYLYNKVKAYDPKKYFITKEHFPIEQNGIDLDDFLQNYEYFHLTPLEDLEIPLEDDEKNCYTYYLSLIDNFRQQLENKVNTPNIWNVKAPKAWLKIFETKYQLPRKKLKDFLSTYELPNVPYIIEDIRKVGGIVYNGAKSFLIAKQRSLEQEKFWENVLKEKYGEDIGTQFKFKNCVFDMINIGTRTLYECKLGLKDFNTEQYQKYLNILGTQYNIIYPIGTDCVVNMKKKKIYTTNVGKYYGYILGIPLLKNPNEFDELIKNYKVVRVENIIDYV